MKKTLAWVLALVLVLVASLACAEGQSDPLRIAVVTNLSGASANMGDRTKWVVEYEVGLINAAGGINGLPVEIKYFDAGDNQQTCIEAVQLAVNTDGIDAIFGSFGSQYVVAYSEIIAEAKIPHLTGGTSATFKKLDNDYLWSVRMLDDSSGKATADAAIAGGITKPCVVYMTNASGQSSRDNVVARYEELGHEITLEIGFDNTTTVDYTSIVTKAMASDANGIILAMNYMDCASCVMTLKQNGYSLPICGCSSLISTSVSDIIGDLCDGMFGVADYTSNNDREENRVIVEGLLACGTGEYTVSWMEASMYDIILAITEAAKLGGANTPEAIQEGLYQINGLEGALGTLNYHDDHNFASYLYVCEFEGSDLVYKGMIDKPE